MFTFLFRFSPNSSQNLVEQEGRWCEGGLNLIPVNLLAKPRCIKNIRTWQCLRIILQQEHYASYRSALVCWMFFQKFWGFNWICLQFSKVLWHFMPIQFSFLGYIKEIWTTINLDLFVINGMFSSFLEFAGNVVELQSFSFLFGHVYVFWYCQCVSCHWGKFTKNQ